MALFLLLVLSALAFAEATVQDCFAQDTPYRFWEQPQYIASNSQYIRPIFIDHFYSYTFDETARNDAWNTAFMNGSGFLDLFPEGERQGFAKTAKLLDGINIVQNISKNSAEIAHNTSLIAQMFGVSELDIYLRMMNRLTLVGILLEQSDVRYQLAMGYVENYAPNFWSALAGSSRMFSDANEAGRLAAAKVDGQMEILHEAGAENIGYAGKAKGAYVNARNLLADVGFCGRQQRGAKAVLDYFNSSPQLPHTMPQNLSLYLKYTIGKTNDSTLAILAGNYLSLKQAYADMISEYDASRAAALDAKGRLENAVTRAEREQLAMLTDLPGQNVTGLAIVGTSSSGLAPELWNVRMRIAGVQEKIDGAKTLRDGGKQGYLADAITAADAADAMAKTETGTVENILGNARYYENLERAAAQAAIDDAAALLEKPLPAGSADVKILAEEKIAFARKNFNLASGESTIGERYRDYQQALLSAQEARELLKGGAGRPMKQNVERALADLERFLDSAEEDGVPAEYERLMLAEDRIILANTVSSEKCEEIIAHAAQLKLSVWQRLEAKYSGLGGKYAALADAVLSIREVDGKFLPGFDAVKGAFAGGKLDIGSKAGGLKALEAQIDSLNGQVRAVMPQKLSEILSKNAKAVPAHNPFVLGQPSRYRLDVYARNPTQLGVDKQVAFSVETEIPIYSGDRVSGDEISDAYPDGKNTVLTVPAVSARQEFHFVFEKQDMPAQITSTGRSCSEADENSAEETASVGFFASRGLDSLAAAAAAPDGTDSAQIAYRGARRPASLTSAENGMAATGEISGVASGANSLGFYFTVKNPFVVSIMNRTAQGIGSGMTRISYVARISSQALECGKAEVLLYEPYSGITDFSVFAISDERVSSREPVETGSASRLGFSFSPLRTDAPQEFVVTFAIRNATQAVSEAMQGAEMAAQLFNRTSDLEAIEDAKRLAALNRTADALTILAGLQDSQKKISTADYKRFIAENSSAEGMIASALDMQAQLAEQDLASAAAQLATLVSALQAGAVKSGSYAEAGQYKQATDSLRSASSAFRTGLSSLSWKSSSQAADDYAKARKAAQGGRAAELSGIEKLVALSQKQFSNGNQLESFLSSSLASWKLLTLQSIFEQDAQGAKSAVQRISSDFSALQKQAEEELAAYSSQYSALTTQSKRKMPLAPADAQKALQDAAREMQKAASAKDATVETMLAANKSYSSLEAVLGRIRGGLSSLQGTANTSLGMARIALAEARQKAAPEDAGDLAAIEKELNKADDMLANGLYADSLSSSDRALGAASLFIQKKAGLGAIEPKTIALGLVSLLFIAGAAYYFWQGREWKEKPEKKKEIPRAD